MAGASISVYKFDSVVRGQHVYKSVWTSLTDWCSKTRKCILMQEDDEHDKYAIKDRLWQHLKERCKHHERYFPYRLALF